MSSASIACSVSVSEGRSLRLALEFILQGALARPVPSDDPVIGLVIPTEPGGADWAGKAASVLSRHPRCAGLVVAHNHDEQIYRHLRPRLRVPFCQGVRFVNPRGALLFDLLHQVAHFSKKPASNETMDRTREVIFAKALYRCLERYSHGGVNDITNQVLAPLNLRLRLGQAIADDKELSSLRKFGSDVIEPARTMGSLGAELWTVFERLFTAVEARRPCNDDLEHAMDLLTECRQSAGAAVPLRTREEEVYVAPARNIANDKRFRVLVVDDHWKFWELFFEELREKVRAILGAADVTFKPLPLKDNASAKSVLAQLAGYDLVLLDIFLGRNLDREDGLTILSSIRKHYVNIPVILWTSSRETELPAMARLAHGFLFKKSSSPERIACVLARHLREGRARRLYPLPNHFFDQSIVDEDNRKCALRFTEYCSKQLDGFHALDDRYFRYFTDHGGRHLFKLLEHLGEALRPLADDPKVFAQHDAREQEDEILALYLAVFLHEFGMLRLQGHGEPVWDDLMQDALSDEKQKARLSGELNLVRNLHALRAMVLLARIPERHTDPRNHWPDEEGHHQAFKRFIEKGRCNVQVAVALIAGHHSRLLPLTLKDGKWSHDFAGAYANKVESALKRLDAPLRRRVIQDIQKRFYASGKVEQELLSLLNSINSPDRLERLRKHCAIFRFVDAIDVDQSRNPARFLCAATKISATDRRETLKRQVIRKVGIEGGTVHMQTNVPPPPAEAVLSIVAAEAAHRHNDTGVADLISRVPTEPRELEGWIKAPWRERCSGSMKWRIDCQKLLDAWLEGFWEHPENPRPDGLLERRGHRYSTNAKLLIASITALSVAWEILDEYTAISDCNLEEKIRLGDFWRNISKDGRYSRSSQRKMLTILFHPQDGLNRLMEPHVVHSTLGGGL